MITNDGHDDAAAHDIDDSDGCDELATLTSGFSLSRIATTPIAHECS